MLRYAVRHTTNTAAGRNTLVAARRAAAGRNPAQPAAARRVTASCAEASRVAANLAAATHAAMRCIVVRRTVGGAECAIAGRFGAPVSIADALG